MGNFIRTLLAGALLVAVGVSQAQVARVSGSITTQNLVPTGAATAGSCVEIDMANKGTVTIEVRDTYTGALSGQVTTAGPTWTTLAPTPFVPATATGTPTATIASGATGFWRVNEAVGALKFRLCALAAVTGSATVTLQTSPVSAGSGGSSGGGGAVTVANGADTALGATTDGACAGDATSGCTVESRLIRIAQNLTTVNASVNASNAQLPTTLGTAATAASLSTAISTSDAGPVAPGAATATRGISPVGTYTAAGITLTDGQQAGARMTAAGALQVSDPDSYVVTGSCTANGSITNFPVLMDGYESAFIQITSVGGGVTLNFEWSNDGSTVFGGAARTITTTGATAASLTAAATGIFRTPKQGRYLHLRCSSYTSGTPAATVYFSKAPDPGNGTTYIGGTTVMTVQGTVAQDGAVSGVSPLIAGVEARTTNKTAMSTDGDGVRAVGTMVGVPIVRLNSIPEADWHYAAASGGIVNTTDVTIAAAPAAGLRNYLAALDVCNTHATVDTEVVVKDGATVLWRRMMKALAVGCVALTLNTPIRQPTTATALTAAAITTGAAVYVNGTGYVAP